MGSRMVRETIKSYFFGTLLLVVAAHPTVAEKTPHVQAMLIAHATYYFAIPFFSALFGWYKLEDRYGIGLFVRRQCHWLVFVGIGLYFYGVISAAPLFAIVGVMIAIPSSITLEGIAYMRKKHPLPKMVEHYYAEKLRR